MEMTINEDMFRCEVCGNNKFWGPLLQPKQWKCKFCGNLNIPQVMLENND